MYVLLNKLLVHFFYLVISNCNPSGKNHQQGTSVHWEPFKGVNFAQFSLTYFAL